MLSLVLPVYNEEAEIGRLLKEILLQKEPPGGFEVLIADGGSTDRTRAIVEEFAAKDGRIRLVENPKRLSSAGRNAGASAALGRYILFLDGHCAIPRNDYLCRAVALFAETGADCLSRPQHLDALASGGWAEAIAAARHSRFGHNPGSDIYAGEPGFTDPRTAGAAYKRECFQRVGMYDERFDACEDVEFNHRIAEAGFRAFRHPDLRIDYRPRSSLSGLFRQMYRYGRGRARLMARHRRLVPWPLVGMTAAVMALVAVLLLRGFGSAAIASSTLAGAWALTAGIEAVRASGGARSTPVLMRTLAAFAVIHTALLTGFWIGLAEYGHFRAPSAPKLGGPRSARMLNTPR
ncbi:MAG: glycosyltransferase family 2 protein [Candidatus Eisenbacteria bacterium]